MKKSISILILISYLLVGFGVPLDSRATNHNEIEVTKKKSPPRTKYRACHLWSTVKHVAAKKPTTRPDENHLIHVEVKAPYLIREELLDPQDIYLAARKSPLSRELRAPPQL